MPELPIAISMADMRAPNGSWDMPAKSRCEEYTASCMDIVFV